MKFIEERTSKNGNTLYVFVVGKEELKLITDILSHVFTFAPATRFLFPKRSMLKSMVGVFGKKTRDV